MRTKQYIKEINQYRPSLSPENQDKFDTILLKLRFSRICDHDAEEFSHHCLDLFLQAEKEQVPIEEILNTSDLEAFCDEFIQETKQSYSYLQKIYWRIRYIPLTLFLFTGVWEMLIGYLSKEWIAKQFTIFVPVSISMILDFFIVLFLIDLLINKTYLFSKILNGSDKKKDRLATLTLFLGFVLLTGVFVVSKLFFSQVLCSVNFLVFVGIAGAICALQWFFENRKA